MAGNAEIVIWKVEAGWIRPSIGIGNYNNIRTQEKNKVNKNLYMQKRENKNKLHSTEHKIIKQGKSFLEISRGRYSVVRMWAGSSSDTGRKLTIILRRITDMQFAFVTPPQDLRDYTPYQLWTCFVSHSTTSKYNT